MVYDIDIAYSNRVLTESALESISLKGHAAPTTQVHRDTGGLGGLAECETLVPLLLQLSPNLERAHFHLPDVDAAYSNMPMQSHSSSASLRALYLSSSRRRFVLDEAASIIRLAPNLEVLHLSGCAAVTELFPSALSHEDADDPPPLANLAELACEDSDLTSASLRNLLAAVGPRLSTVDIRRPRRSRQQMPEVGDVEFDEVVALLQPWSNTLKALKFVLDGDVFSMLVGSLDLLPRLRELETLETQASFFKFLYDHQRDVLVRLIPRSVRRLRLLGYSHLGAPFEDLLAAIRSGGFPHLTRIEINNQEFEPESPACEKLRQVGTSFVSAGVDFQVHDMPG